mmetsp:Transcript_1209/g.1554  ORF Transcript_1209/g.1554 Transcript_1209/m.1554 type:complete len:252 (+) Transcript_1209:34-789(+)
MNASGKCAKVVEKCLIFIAMEVEASPLIKELNLSLNKSIFHKNAPFNCYSGLYKGKNVCVVTNGRCKDYGVDNVGTVAAGISLWLAIEKIQPDLVINAGTAGGFKRKGAEIIDVFISSRTAYHDRRIAVPKYKEWATCAHDSIPTENLRSKLGFKQGIVTTSNSLDYTETDERLMIENEASLKDMEAAAIAWTCKQHETPFFCLKVVTDIVDGSRPPEEEFYENLKAASEKLQSVVPQTLDFVIGRAITEL